MKKHSVFVIIAAVLATTLVAESCVQIQLSDLSEEGVSRTEIEMKSEPETEPDTKSEPETEGPKEPLDLIRQEMDKEYSFAIKMHYLDLGIQGFEMEHVQVFAKDKSFRFHTGGKQWHHQYDYEDEFIDRFYYCYEGSDYVCYMNLDGSEYTRTVLNAAQLAEIEATRRQTTSGIGFLPAEIADFRETTLDEPEGIRTFAFNYSLRKAQASYGYLGSFLNNVFSMYGQEYEGPELTLSGKLTTDINLRPQSLSYDFSELEPYVLSVVVYSEKTIGALSYEITFDYDLADHVDMEP